LLKFYGFLFINNNIFNYLNRDFFSYQIKKTLYSFSYKNEIQRFILRRYLKNNFFTDYSLKNNIFFSHQHPHIVNNQNQNFYLNYFSKSLNPDFKNNFNFFNFVTNKNNEIQKLVNKNISSFNN
jgi:hypothetical protein